MHQVFEALFHVFYCQAIDDAAHLTPRSLHGSLTVRPEIHRCVSVCVCVSVSVRVHARVCTKGRGSLCASYHSSDSKNLSTTSPNNHTLESAGAHRDFGLAGVGRQSVVSVVNPSSNSPARLPHTEGGRNRRGAFASADPTRQR